MSVTVICGSKVLADKVKPASTFLGRFCGLMGCESLEDGEGLMLISCSCIHTFFMKMSIDAVYLSENFVVLGIETLRPWKIGAKFKNAVHVLELGGGTANICKGDRLEIRGLFGRRDQKWRTV